MRIAHALIAVALVGGACKGDQPAGSGAAHGGSATETGGASKQPDELITGDAKGPDGVAWKRVETPFGTAELPDGGGWSLHTDTPMQVQHEDGTVIMLQAQGGIDPDQLAEYLTSYDEVQRRDAPKYAKGKETIGSLKGNTAARVESTFDNGTKFETRDYVIITPTRKVAGISGRAPTTVPAARLAALVDHIAATAQIK